MIRSSPQPVAAPRAVVAQPPTHRGRPALACWSALAAMLSCTLLLACGDDFPRDQGGAADAIGADSGAVDAGLADADRDGTSVDDAPLPHPCTAADDCALSEGPCERDACLPSGSCAIVLLAEGAPCDDGEACSQGATCQASVCQGGANTCPCATAADCATYEDGDLCNGTLYCDLSGAAPACKPNPATVVVCKGGGPCAPRSCDTKTGACVATPAPNGLACDDGEACTSGDTCVDGACTPKSNSCACQTTADCAAQEDGDLCNGTLYCDNSAFPPVCKTNPATTVTCSPSLNACESSVCDAKTGACVALALPDGTTCTDGDSCSGPDGADACKEGSCEAGEPTCACKVDADCAGSEDGDLCNGTLYCDTSQAPFHCAINPKTVVTCDTSVDTTCSSTQCNPKTGACAAVAAAAGTICSDGDVCSVGDVCKAGACAAGKNECACKSDGDCGQFEDGDLCNGTLYCDKAAAPFVCKVKPSSVVQCNPSLDSACVKATCAPKTGNCVATMRPNGANCDADGNPCTVNDTCKEGACEAGPNTCECIIDKDCAKHDDADVCNGTLYCNTVSKPFRCDVNPLTVVGCASGANTDCLLNTCDPTSGVCAPKALSDGVMCNADNNLCTGPDRCLSGACESGPAVCACTKDADCGGLINACAGEAFCDKSQAPFACAVKPKTATACSLPSTKTGACSAAACVEEAGKPACEVQDAPPGTPCNDGLSWTVADVCDGKGACSGQPGLVCAQHSDCAALDTDADLCNSGVRCVIASGQSTGACQPVTTPIVCEASTDTCKIIACQPSTGLCLPSAVTKTFGKACDDGDPCTTSSACQGDGCTWAKGWQSCDDGNGCTIDSCATKQGCVHQADEGRACSDGDACSEGDICEGSKCIAGPGEKSCSDGDACTTDSCTDGKCAHAAVANCTGCKKHEDCTDNSECTQDSCDVAGVCSHKKLSNLSCADGDPCTDDGVCVDGVCKTTPKDCSTTDTCKVGSCKPTVGCVKVSKTGGSCDDGKACTLADTCSKGACLGSAKACDDNNPCTSDACSESGGTCVFTPLTVTTQCNDGIACTADDVCTSGVCKGTAKVCGDTDPCTQDSCEVTSGECKFEVISGCVGCKDASSCDDNNVCTKDGCKSGKCSHIGLSTGPCDDGDKCTEVGICAAGECKTNKKTCSSPDPCKTAACNTKIGCVLTARPDGTSCDDGDACTSATSCKAGACAAGATKNCSDAKACTLDSCDAKTGACVSKASAAACDDGSACTAGSCDSAGGCLQTPANEGKSCTASNNKASVCKAGSCGACGLWSFAMAPSKQVPSGRLTAARHFNAGTLVFAGDGNTSGGNGFAWSMQTDANGTKQKAYVSATATGNGMTGLATGNDTGKELYGVTAPITGSTEKGRLVRQTISTGALSNIASYDLEAEGRLAAIAKLEKANRWLLVGERGDPPSRGLLLVVDKKGKDIHKATLAKSTALNACVVRGDKLLVSGGFKLSGSVPTALLVGHDEKLKQLWQKAPPAASASVIFGLAKSTSNHVIAVGADGKTVAKARAVAWAIKGDTGATVWKWSTASGVAGELRGAAESSGGGIIGAGLVLPTLGLKQAGLLVRINAEGKLVWRREVRLLSKNSLLSVHVAGSHAIAAGVARDTKNLGWIMRFRTDGSLYCK